MGKICHAHCPSGDSGQALAALAFVVLVVAAGAVVRAYFWWLLGIAVVSVVSSVAFCRYLLRHHTLLAAPWLAEDADQLTLPAAERPALSPAPRAIEPRHVIPGIVLSSSSQQGVSRLNQNG